MPKSDVDPMDHSGNLGRTSIRIEGSIEMGVSTGLCTPVRLHAAKSVFGSLQLTVPRGSLSGPICQDTLRDKPNAAEGLPQSSSGLLWPRDSVLSSPERS